MELFGRLDGQRDGDRLAALERAQRAGKIALRQERLADSLFGARGQALQLGVGRVFGAEGLGDRVDVAERRVGGRAVAAFDFDEAEAQLRFGVFLLRASVVRRCLSKRAAQLRRILQGAERRAVLAELIERFADIERRLGDVVLEFAVVRRRRGKLGVARLRLTKLVERAVDLALRLFDVADVGVRDGDVALQGRIGGIGGGELLRKGEAVAVGLERGGQVVARLLRLGDVVERDRPLAQDGGVVRMRLRQRVVDRQRGLVLRERAVEVALVGERGADEIVGHREVAPTDDVGGFGCDQWGERLIGLAGERQRARRVAEVAQRRRAFELRRGDARHQVGRRLARADQLLLQRARAVEHVLDHRHRHAGGGAEALGEAEDEVVGGLGGEAQRVLRAVALLLGERAIASPPARQREGGDEADAGAPGDAPVGGGDRLGVGDAAFLLLAPLAFAARLRRPPPPRRRSRASPATTSSPKRST